MDNFPESRLGPYGKCILYGALILLDLCFFGGKKLRLQIWWVSYAFFKSDYLRGNWVIYIFLSWVYSLTWKLGTPGWAGLSWVTLWSRRYLSPGLSVSAFFSLVPLGSHLQPMIKPLSLMQKSFLVLHYTNLTLLSRIWLNFSHQGMNNSWYLLISYFLSGTGLSILHVLSFSSHSNPRHYSYSHFTDEVRDLPKFTQKSQPRKSPLEVCCLNHTTIIIIPQGTHLRWLLTLIALLLPKLAAFDYGYSLKEKAEALVMYVSNLWSLPEVSKTQS